MVETPGFEPGTVGLQSEPGTLAPSPLLDLALGFEPSRAIPQIAASTAEALPGLVATTGVEPARPFGHYHLKVARLPDSATSRSIVGARPRTRTGTPRGPRLLRALRLPFRPDGLNGGAGGGIRTHPPLRTPVSETGASTASPHRQDVDFVGEPWWSRTTCAWIKSPIPATRI